MTNNSSSTNSGECCVICGEGSVSERTFIHLTKNIDPYPLAAIRFHILTCDTCESDYSAHEQSKKNGVVMQKFLADMKYLSENKALPKDMISCWSCKINMYLVDHAHNDGHCPGCNCEIDLEEFDTESED